MTKMLAEIYGYELFAFLRCLTDGRHLLRTSGVWLVNARVPWLAVPRATRKAACPSMVFVDELLFRLVEPSRNGKQGRCQGELGMICHPRSPATHWLVPTRLSFF